MPPYERLLAWQKAHALALRVYSLSAMWPPDERFGLTAQLRRAVVSIPANIAEGAAKRGPREFRRYLDIAAGSHAEVEYLLQLATDLKYAHTNDGSLHRDCDEIGRLLWGLHRSIRDSC